jgi:hypothetical protein
MPSTFPSCHWRKRCRRAHESGTGAAPGATATAAAPSGEENDPDDPRIFLRSYCVRYPGCRQNLHLRLRRKDKPDLELLAQDAKGVGMVLEMHNPHGRPVKVDFLPPDAGMVC